MLKDLSIPEVHFQQPPVQSADEVLKRASGRRLAVSTTLLYGAYFPKVSQMVLEALRGQEPVARTTTFLIYDFTRESGR